MLSAIFSGVARCYHFIERFARGPRLVSRIRRPDGFKWGIPIMLASLPYFFLADICTRLIENGGDALLALSISWGLVWGIAFLALGLLGLIKLLGASIREAKKVNSSRHQRNGAATVAPASTSEEEHTSLCVAGLFRRMESRFNTSGTQMA